MFDKQLKSCDSEGDAVLRAEHKGDDGYVYDVDRNGCEDDSERIQLCSSIKIHVRYGRMDGRISSFACLVSHIHSSSN